MNEINVLTSKIYNRIAAGEVVERPSSVIKELVENSIDAKSKNIDISIIGGGKISIIVSDDGCGISKSQLKKALQAHATSKISSLKDLDSISTLGFRGEALASIASVSKIKITSKTSEQELGAYICSEGGNGEEIGDIGFSNGTEIEVDNLFFNTPAREKFLKTERGEEGEITSLVARFILANPDIAFKYSADNEVVLQSFGDGFESAFISVYGTKTLDDCFYIDTEKNGIKICGYVGKHYFSKANRSYQSVFLNGRYIINQTISAAISNAYASYLMKRQYPFYVLAISIPVETVDVNVHPNKMDVRFSNNGIIYGAIYSIISKVLDGSSEALNIASVNSDNKNKKIDKSKFDIPVSNDTNEKYNETYKFDKFVFGDCKPNTKPVSFDNDLFEKEEQNKCKENNGIDIFAENKAYIEKLEKEKLNKSKQNFDTVIQQNISLERELTYIGQGINTYLFFEDGIDIYIVDQHAAHERIIFDKLMASFNAKSIDTQPLLLPYVVSTNDYEHQFLLDNVSVLHELGIEIEEFGRNSFKVSSIPVVISTMNLSLFFKDLLSDLSELKSISLNSLLYDKIAQKACKSAIKSGDKLSEFEIKELTQVLKNNLGLKCPHGRPVCVKITRTEIDKWFKRIV